MKIQRDKTKSVKITMKTYNQVVKFAKNNSTPNGKIIIGRFVDNAILEKLDREERNFQIKP